MDYSLTFTQFLYTFKTLTLQLNEIVTVKKINKENTCLIIYILVWLQTRSLSVDLKSCIAGLTKLVFIL